MPIRNRMLVTWIVIADVWTLELGSLPWTPIQAHLLSAAVPPAASGNEFNRLYCTREAPLPAATRNLDYKDAATS